MALAVGCLFGKWPWPWGACWGRCLEGLEGLGGFGGFGKFWQFGAFAGGQTAALTPIESHCCGLGPGVPVGEVALALGCLLDKVFGGFGRFWRAPGGFGGFWSGPGVPAGQGVWRVWTVLESARRVWRVLEGLGGCLEGFGAFGGFWSVWSVCGLANGSFESQ